MGEPGRIERDGGRNIGQAMPAAFVRRSIAGLWRRDANMRRLCRGQVLGSCPMAIGQPPVDQVTSEAKAKISYKHAVAVENRRRGK